MTIQMLEVQESRPDLDDILERIGEHEETPNIGPLNATVAARWVRALRERKVEELRLRMWYEHRLRSLRRQQSFLEESLKGYVRAEAEETGIKRFPVGDGTGSVTKARPTTEWDFEAATRDGWLVTLIHARTADVAKLDAVYRKKVLELVEWTKPDAAGRCEAVLAEDVKDRDGRVLLAKGDVLPGLVKDTRRGQVTVSINVGGLTDGVDG